MSRPKKPKTGRPAKPAGSTKPRDPDEPNSVLPMQLRVGDRFTDETGEWEIISRPYGTVGGKTVHARVRKVGEPAVTEERTWSAYEKVAVRRG
jgi:hypothetical protein